MTSYNRGFSRIIPRFGRYSIPKPIASVRTHSFHFATKEMDHHSALIEPNADGIAEAASMLRSGQLLAFPTETVYGLGANALNEEAVLSIFRAKGRPLTDPLIVHIAQKSDAYRLIDIDEASRKAFDALADRFWPGPLTVIVKASSLIPLTVTANTGFVGIRLPKHELARRLIEQAGVPVAAPSANRFGHVSPTRASHVLDDLAEKGVKVLNGESKAFPIDPSCEFGIESTVVKLDSEHAQLLIYRQGAVSQQLLQDCLAEASLSWSTAVVTRVVKMHGQEEKKDAVGEVAPGQAVTHYAPDVPCYLVQGVSETSTSSGSPSSAGGMELISSYLHVSSSTLQEGAVVIDFGGQLRELAGRVLAYRDLSARKDAAEAARNLFDTLRWAETVTNAKVVLLGRIEDQSVSSKLSELDLSLGLADRVFRAASGLSVQIHVHPDI